MLAINANIRQKRFQIPIHLGLGHEAIAVAVSQTKHKQDCLILSHRNMHYNVANQPDAQKIFDEYDLQDSGLGQGKYGSMNLIHPEQGLVYSDILATIYVLQVELQPNQVKRMAQIKCNNRCDR